MSIMRSNEVALSRILHNSSIIATQLPHGYHPCGGYSRDGYSRARGYSRSEAKDSMMEQLGAMMEDASNDREREAIRMCMEHLNQE